MLTFYGAPEENINYKNSVTLPSSFCYHPLAIFSFFFRHVFFSSPHFYFRAATGSCNADLTLVIDITMSSSSRIERPPSTPPRVDASIKIDAWPKLFEPRPLDLYILIKGSAIIGSRNGIFHGLNDRYNS